MHLGRTIPLFPLAAVLCSNTPALRADDGWDRPTVTLQEDNDLGFSDRHYTQGLYLRFLSGDHTNLNWFTAHAPSLGYDAARWKWGLEGGQQMFTPEDISATRLLKQDRPYGGWLFGGLLFQQRGEMECGIPVKETFGLQVGVVGPESQAENTQVWWHTIWEWKRPRGWDNQIQTEVGGLLHYERRYRLAIGDVWSLQLLPGAGFNLGNIRTDARLEGVLRAGYNIPNEFGLNDTVPGWCIDPGFYIFGAARGRAVLVDIFLDGNHFRESHEVHKEPLVAEGTFGLAITSRHAELTVTHVERTREFTRQKESDAFTSVAFTAKF
jgi:lipid A 3-O-deacylase